MIITFSGLDGTGKTTYAEMVADHMRGGGKKCIRFHAIKSSLSYFFTHKIVGVVSKKAKQTAESGLRDKGGSFTNGMLAFVKKAFFLADILLFNICYGRLKGKEGDILVADRYFYDELVQARYLGIAGRLFSRIYENLIIKPDVAFFVELPPEKAYGRKNEYDIEYFKAKSPIYEDTCKGGGFSIIPDVSLSEAERLIKEEIDGRSSDISP